MTHKEGLHLCSHINRISCEVREVKVMLCRACFDIGNCQQLVRSYLVQETKHNGTHETLPWQNFEDPPAHVVLNQWELA